MTSIAFLSAVFIATVLALGAGTGTTVRAESDDSPTTPVTVWLYEGWNLVGWLGEHGSVEELFDQASEIEAVYAQAPRSRDTETIEWERVDRSSGRVIRSGEALWVRVSRGTHPRAWRQEALRELPDRSLPAGQHAVVWAWDGARSIGATMGRLVERLSHAYLWDGRQQAYELHSPQFSSLDWWDPDVQVGGAVIVQLDGPAVWGPPTEPVVTRSRNLTERDWQTIDNVALGVHRYFEKWLGIVPRGFEIFAQDFPLPCLSGGSTYALLLYVPCPHLRQLVGQTMSERYVSAALEYTRSLDDHDEPEWLIVGHAHYVRSRWLSAAGIRPYETIQSDLIGFARATDLSLDSETLNAHRTHPWPPPWNTSRQAFQRALGTLAVDWLVQQRGTSALRQYAGERLNGDWRGAFERAFGMTVDRAIKEFEEYRAQSIAADGDAPRLSRPLHHIVFLGPITEARIAVVEEVEKIVDFFEHEYGTVAEAATFVLDLDPKAYDEIRGTVEGGHLNCGNVDDSIVFVADDCMYPFIIAHEYVHVLQEHWEHGKFASQPRWLVEGAAEYLAMQQSAIEGPVDLDSAWRSRQEFARGIIEALPAELSDAELAVATIERDSYYKIYILAVRHFVELFGIESLFEAFSMPYGDGSQNFAERFPGAFGITLQEFFASFGSWLRSLL